MPWKSKSFQPIVEKARKFIYQEFSQLIQDIPKSEVLFCTIDELISAIVNQWIKEKKSLEFIEGHKTLLLPYAVGKYFAYSDQIWLVKGQEDYWDTLLHELLHSIQKCMPNREPITAYLTYILTKNTEIIKEQHIQDWDELKRLHGIDGIKKRFLNTGDCEDF